MGALHPHRGPGQRYVVCLDNGGFAASLETHKIYHQPSHELDAQRRESLGLGLSRPEHDDYLDEYSNLLGPLSHYTRL